MTIFILVIKNLQYLFNKISQDTVNIVKLFLVYRYMPKMNNTYN